MNRRSVQLSGFYLQLLQLYPPSFREDYLEEMAIVFEIQLEARGNITIWQAIQIALKEILPLPGLLITAYLRERRQQPMKTTLNRWFSHPDLGSWPELVLTAIPFLLMGILPGLFSLIPAIKNLQFGIKIPIIVIMALTLVGLGLLGLLASLPRWVLTYAGILLTLFTFGGMLLGANFRIFQFPLGWERITATAIFLAIFLALQFLLTGLLLRISEKIILTRGFQHRVRSDPSLLAYFFYGGSFLIMAINYDDIARGGYYHMLSSTIMILGAWGYFKSTKSRSKLIALTAGITVATGLALIAKLTLVDYPITFVEAGSISIPSPVIYVGLTWLTSVVMILLPPLVFRTRPLPEKT